MVSRNSNNEYYMHGQLLLNQWYQSNTQFFNRIKCSNLNRCIQVPKCIVSLPKYQKNSCIGPFKKIKHKQQQLEGQELPGKVLAMERTMQSQVESIIYVADVGHIPIGLSEKWWMGRWDTSLEKI